MVIVWRGLCSLLSWVGLQPTWWSLQVFSQPLMRSYVRSDAMTPNVPVVASRTSLPFSTQWDTFACPDTLHFDQITEKPE
ncbi:uncharacterized protein BDZ99DRAFT_467905 [Mytilinidion resinicola]|uniref:Secreted protein n=1 Tax=Mytilinidion resinicola TaxID=574789 RepID=A0A6A6Y4P4_9PEZI|nr:uncharacterized protein BDZ99DRAFT_467905 [Mytilinidion resinicola]KAF2803776.1 hypothetical protein BDZ99DRAFT_467905 [Mytilinidion resinicola]